MGSALKIKMEEMMNAMEVLADTLYHVIMG